MSRTDELEALSRGELTVTEVQRREQRRRRRWLLGSALLVTGLVSTQALSAGTCAQTLPAPLTTFCPNEPALASEINGNFRELANSISIKLGPLTDARVSTKTVDATVGTLDLQTVTGGATRTGGTLQVGSSVQVGTNASLGCTTATAGTFRQRDGALDVCMNNAWLQVAGVGPAYVSCSSIRSANPSAPDGTYTLSAGGYTFYTQCDMSGGGYTLIQGHAAVIATLPSQGVGLRSGTYLPAAAVRALANNSSQVRFKNDDTGASLTSPVNDPVLNQLRALTAMQAGNPGAWTVSGAITTAVLSSSCGTSGTYPDVYHACGNSTGLHVIGAVHTFNNSQPSHALSVWVR